MTTPAEHSSSRGSGEQTAGFLSVISIVGSLLGLAYQPIKVMPFAFLLALIATGMAPRDNKLPLVAIVIGSFCFVGGLTIAVLTNHKLY